MHAPACRSVALLAAALSFAACATTPPSENPAALETGASAAPPSTSGAPKEPDPAVLPGQGKSFLYQNLKSWTDAWIQAYAGPGGANADEARSLETAIARETWARFDEVLQDLKESPNPRWRTAAARGLGFVSNPRVVPALQQALGDADAFVLAAALVSLARIADVHTDDPAVGRLLTYPDKFVQGNAALCLARVFLARRQQALPPVEPPARAASLEADLRVLLFDTEDPILRADAAQALGGLGSPGAEEALLNRIRDDHPLVRLKVAQSLSYAGTAKSLDGLVDALGREGEKNVQVMLALALGSIVERGGRTPPLSDLGTDAGRWRQWLKK